MDEQNVRRPMDRRGFLQRAALGAATPALVGLGSRSTADAVDAVDEPTDTADLAATCALPVSYQVTALPHLGGPVTQALGLNDLGQAVGWALDANWISRAVVWSGGSATVLSPGVEAAALGVSSDGRVAGWQNTSSGQRGAVWSGSGATPLPPMRGHVASVASGVNRAGTAAGWSINSIGDPTAVAWRRNRPVRLVPGNGPTNSLAFSVNDAEQIVGRGDFSTTPVRRALLWQGSSMTVLPGLGGGSDQAVAISANGTVAGASLHSATAKFHAVLWQAGALRNLGLFQGVHPTAAYAVNDCATAVGDALVDVAANRTVAVVWQNGQARDLNTLVPPGSGWDLRTARAIDGAGQIAGFGIHAGVAGEQAFLLTPVF